MLPSLCGAGNIYGAGMLELGMSMSLEQLVIDNAVAVAPKAEEEKTEE